MKIYSNNNPAARLAGKAMPFLAIAFFCGWATPTNAQNTSVGDPLVYGTVAGNPAISSFNDGTNSLTIAEALTISLDINNQVFGSVVISNMTDGFTINGSGTGTLTSSNTAALSVFGGTNLTISGGTFTGGALVSYSNANERTVGTYLENVQTGTIASATFTGGTVEIRNTESGLPPLPGQSNIVYDAPIAIGSDALVLMNSTNITMGDSTMVVQGGNGGNARSTDTDVYASGGMGLVLLNSTSTISNGVYTGGNGGSATHASGFSGYARGGHGLHASNSVVEIRGGTFTGGSAGTVNGKADVAGTGLTAVDGSHVVVSNGIFVGKGTAPAIAIENSDLEAYGGTYTAGGLYSATTSSNANHLVLRNGAYKSIVFKNESTNGIQHVSSSNLNVLVDVYQDGGTVAVDNLDSKGFQTLSIHSGTMILSNDFTLATDGQITLETADSQLAFENNLTLQDSSMVDIGLGTMDVTGSLTANTGSTLSFQILGTNQMGSVMASSATFESNSTISVDASQANFGLGLTTNTLITTTSGITTNSVVLDVRTTTDTNIIGRTTWAGAVVNDDFSFVFSTATLSNYWNATGDLAKLADELDAINDAAMNVIINNLGGSASKAAVEASYFNTPNTFQVAMQGLHAAVGQAASRGTEFREQLNLPAGAYGPQDADNDWRFWMKYYGQFYNHDGDGLNSSYDATMHGGVIGMDKSFGPLLIGISGGMGSYRIEGDNSAQQDMSAAHGALYSTLGIGHSYLDAGVAYGKNNVDSRTAAPFVMDGSFDSELISGYIGAGIGFSIPAISTVVTPEASAQYTQYNQDAYTETSSVAVPRSFDEFDADSLRSSIGVNIAMLNTKAAETFSFKIEGRAHWLHEVNPDPGTISFQLQGGANDYVLAYPMLDEDAIKLGIGFTFFNTKWYQEKNVLLRLDFDEVVGSEFNSHNLSAKAIYAF